MFGVRARVRVCACVYVCVHARVIGLLTGRAADAVAPLRVRVCCAQALLLPTTFEFPVLTTVGKDVVSSGRSPVPASYPALSSVGACSKSTSPGLQPV